MSIMLRLFIILLFTLSQSACVKTPEAEKTDEVYWLSSQNWQPGEWHWWYHIQQGTSLFPYDWFVALEQPTLSWTVFGEVPLFSAPDYLGRFGFLPDHESKINPDSLPVGFAKGDEFVDPYTDEAQTVLDLTCAACHTGQLNIRKDNKLIGVRIDGGPAMIDLQSFEKALGYSTVFTDKIPGRFDRFAKRVLKENYNDQTKAALKAKFSAFLKTGLAEQKIIKDKKIYPVEPGFARVDALGRIGNQVFGFQLNLDNLRPADAPVTYPHLWDTSWFDWVQYNGSVQQPMGRSVGEALGVKAPIVLRGDKKNHFKTSVHVENLHKIESLLAGSKPYAGLRAPAWPEQHFGKIDRDKAARGRALYEDYCQSCHLPTIEVLMSDLDTKEPKYWTAKNNHGRRFIKMVMVDLDVIGTDPKQAINFMERKAQTDDLGLGEQGAGIGLDHVSTSATQRYYADNNFDKTKQDKYNQYRDFAEDGARELKAYKARPLDGVWATPPFLHNGSIPNLYQLLSPVEERVASFYLGTHEFDPVQVGYVLKDIKGGFLFDTRIIGNSNKGHEFADKPLSNGVIGPMLTKEDRWALIEFLKRI
ncbi:MAG: hypothetical protein H0W44_06300 [Gammaproteobacteria bacterium]|nr:hypothetical protein [Gammaproteobacteria bacterium]